MKQTEKTAAEIFSEVREIAQKLQDFYYAHEDAMDRIPGCCGMDNIKGWLYEPEGVIEGAYTGETAKAHMTWLYRNFKALADAMERRGAGANGSARGISHLVQYTWGGAYYAAYLVVQIAQKLHIQIAA